MNQKAPNVKGNAEIDAAKAQISASQAQINSQLAAADRKQAAQEQKSQADNTAVFMGFGDILKADFPPPEPILNPVLMSGDLMFLFARRGTAKTLFALQAAVNIAAGQGFLKWTNSKPRRVLYIDGELRAQKLQKRCNLAKELARLGGVELDVDAVNQNLKIVSNDFQPNGMMNLLKPAAKAWLKPLYQWAEVIFFDSLMTLAPSDKNITKSEVFLPIENLLRELRTAGKTCVMLHHAGKSGDQLGDIAKENIFDHVLCLEKIRNEPDTANDETRLRVSFTKSRDLYGDDVEDFQAIISNSKGWMHKAEKSKAEKVKEQYENGLSIREISEEINIPKSTVARILKRQGFDLARGRKAKC